MDAIQQAIATLTAGQPLGEAEAGQVAAQILDGRATPAQIGAFLTALHIRGEEPEHLFAFARVMRRHARPVAVTDPQGLVDTCGTGGDGAGTFNISTAAALVAAGAGARVAKHGNRAVTGKFGSADVLSALGVKIEMDAETAARCLDEAGITFFFAPAFHQAMRHVGPTRREIGIRTLFNLLGPMANPAGAGRQLVGVWEARLTSVFAHVLTRLGARHVMAVHGSDGLDEITLGGPSFIAEGHDDLIHNYEITPEDFGFERAPLRTLAAGESAEANAELIREILGGGGGPRRDVVELNAGAALVVAGRAKDIAEGVAGARQSIDAGSARAALDRLAQASQAGSPA